MMYKARDPVVFLMSNYVPEPNSGCWLWLGPYDQSGYGSLYYWNDGKWRNGRAHRLMLFLTSPNNDPSLLACHHCDVPACVNPDHLFWGTFSDNMRDAARKGRLRGCFVPGQKTRTTGQSLPGSRHGKARLTENQVMAIRASAEPSSILAERYGIRRATVLEIINGRKWKHLPSTPRLAPTRRKLNEEQAIVIRSSAEPALVLARRYGVSHSLITGIKRGEIWSETRKPRLVPVNPEAA